jgi:hypothetical protein
MVEMVLEFPASMINAEHPVPIGKRRIEERRERKGM